MEDFTAGFFILIGLTYSYFLLQYFFTQLFYSKYNMLFLLGNDIAIVTLVFFISSAAEKTENLLYCQAFFYYTILLFVIKRGYHRLNSCLIDHHKMKIKFKDKGFTYVSYHKGIFDRGNSWDEDLAKSPSWLDHTLSFSLILLPIVFTFIGVAYYRNSS